MSNNKSRSKIFSKTSKILASILTLTTILTIAASAASDYTPGLQFYFSAGVMNDTTGEIEVDAKMRNFDTAVPKSMGRICALSFGFEFDTDKFEIQKDADGVFLDTILDENSLIKKASDIETKITEDEERNKTSVTVSFMDSTLKDNLIDKDGSLFTFVLKSKNPKSLWNSFDKYQLSFIADSTVAITYSDSFQVGRVFGTEGIDIGIGGYNVPPTLIPKNVDKHITFYNGQNTVKIDGFTQETDSISYIENTGNVDELMIPVRYLAEAIGMNVLWDGSTMVAEAKVEYKTFKADLKKSAVYVNAAAVYAENGSLVKPVEKNGRIYIPASTVKQLYSGVNINFDGEKAEIYIP